MQQSKLGGVERNIRLRKPPSNADLFAKANGGYKYISSEITPPHAKLSFTPLPVQQLAHVFGCYW